MNTKNNSRYEMTDLKIREIFLTELESKTINQIKVNTICKSIGINRSTFYAHYADVYEILDKISISVGCSLIENFKANSLSEDSIGTKKSLIIVLEHIQEYKTFYNAYFSNVSLEKINKHMDDIFELHIVPFFEKRGIHDRAEKRYHFLFFKSGMIEIIKDWLKHDCQESADFLVNIILKITQ